MKIDGFVLAMLGAVAFALAIPWLGTGDGPLHLGVVTTIGIAFVFFLHGAALAPAAMRAGAANWRLHLVVHGSTYLLFPAIGAAIFFGLQGVLAPEIRLGIFYLCALSSTISSSVAMTAIGRGNVPAAIFDATISGLLGMVLTPLLISLVAKTATGHLALLPAIWDVMKTLLLPFAAGQLLRPWIGVLVTRNKAWTSKADRLVILLIVYSAFCESTAAGLWSRYAPATLFVIALLVLLLLASVIMMTTLVSRTLGFSRADEVTAVFCGSKKSLANGAPIARVLFGQNPALGMIVLPLMMYHQAQLIVCSVLARRYAEKAEGDRPVSEPFPAT
ncbi:bile acid:sodium symporter [Sphingomonas sp. QA11]|uniref:bile acid:sodium symporter family protein n=1 Tax=Sphingomonas sp. QA11 TaxID=2950605 RepID=UPI00234AA1F4|nr:bile acid:sodium symporter family protein [Sphingomonas sp. QA11]WCM28598.1 bile acid:sodium symporter [Sphingomonas sp. QA11]